MEEEKWGLKENVYVPPSAPAINEFEKCKCKPSKEGSSSVTCLTTACENYATQVECEANECCGGACGNNRFQVRPRHPWLETFKVY